MRQVARRRKLRWFGGLALLLAAGTVLWRQWQGPLVPVYRLEERPLVQAVVATGRVVTPTRAQEIGRASCRERVY